MHLVSLQNKNILAYHESPLFATCRTSMSQLNDHTTVLLQIKLLIFTVKFCQNLNLNLFTAILYAE